MAAFDADGGFWGLDYLILRDGAGVALYPDPGVLPEHLVWLSAARYHIHEFDCSRWLAAESVMHDDLLSSLPLPDYYGRNLDALDECLAFALAIPIDGGRVIVFRRYDAFAEFAGRHVLLEICARASRIQMMFGRRLLTLIETSDARLAYQTLDRTIPFYCGRRPDPV